MKRRLPKSIGCVDAVIWNLIKNSVGHVPFPCKAKCNAESPVWFTP